MARLDGGEILIRSLQAQGVDTIFTLHGGHLDAALTAAREAGIRLVDTRHEQAAGIAATGYSRTTGRVGVAMATAGAGVTNLVTAIANAYADAIPGVFIGGAPPLMDVDALSANGGYDQMSLMAGITKWSRQVTEVSLLAETVSRAFHWASEGRPGPVYIEIPSDVLFSRMNVSDVPNPQPAMKVFRPAPNRAAVDAVLPLLISAKRPVIMAGGGVAFSGAGEKLTRFAEASGVPVLTNNKSRGEISTDHPLYSKGFSAVAAMNNAGTPPDLVVLLGARRGLYTGGRRTSLIPETATVIQVDILAEELGRLGQVDYGVVADAGEWLDSMLAAAENTAWPDRSEWVLAIRGPIPAAVVATDDVMTPEVLAVILATQAPDDAIMVLDGGETPAWFDAKGSARQPRSWLAHGYLGMMGEGMPLAIGAKVGNPDRTVICLTGDGAVGFNVSEFDTMVRHKLPIIVIVNNDAQWAMSSHGQDLIYGPGNRVISELLPSRYDLVAAGYGAHAELVERPSDLAGAIRRAIDSGLPACINVLTESINVAPVTRRMIGAAMEGLVSPEGRSRVPYADILEVN